MSKSGIILDPNHIEICPVCKKQRPLTPRKLGSLVCYTPTWEGHSECHEKVKTEGERLFEARQAEEERLWIRRSIRDGFDESGIAPERRGFADLKKYANNAKAVESAKRWAMPNPGFCVFGPPGTGKSHILAAIAQTIPEKHEAEFSMIRWGRWVKATYAESDFGAKEKMARWVRIVPVLFIDDFGAEKLSEHAESLLDDVIHEREEFRRPTFMSTNLTPEGLQKILTPRLWSRLQSLMEFIPVGGKDIRKAREARCG